jgi:hypothetical protein
MADRLYYFETLEVYHTANQFARVLGAISASAGCRRQRKVRRLIRDCVMLGTSIAGGNAELPPDQELTLDERLSFLRLAQAAVARMRSGLQHLQQDRVGSLSHIGAGLELLERIEQQLQENTELLKGGFVPPGGAVM